MSIDLKTASVEPLRRTFDHIAAKLGPGQKPEPLSGRRVGLAA